MHRPIAKIEADIDHNRDEQRRLREESIDLNKELAAARLAEAKDNPHPWTGKKVKRIRHGWRGAKTERGTLILREENQRHLRNHNARVGELFVVSDSGLTGYSFDPENQSSGHYSAWELVS